MKNILFLVGLVFLSSVSLATPVGPMSYQGRLLDDNGIPVTGSYNFVIKIYNDPSVGVLKYQESFAGVSVDDGVYSLKIGTDLTPDVGTWDLALWQGNLNNLYLEIAVNGETLSPRHELTSAPHAFTATLALSAESLGAKTAAEYDNILEGVCVASKGKWLEKIEKCLGAGASFPGPIVYLSTLTISTDLTDLDLSKADISGINFSGADLSGTLFNDSTYSVEGMSGANLSNTKWDGAVATDSTPYTVAATTNLSNASMKNMDMSKWNLSLPSYAQYTKFSAAYISQCPDAIFGSWECRYMRGTSGDYFLLGQRADFSVSSAASTTNLGESRLDIDDDKLDNILLNYASFVGVVLTQDFLNSSLYAADLSYAKLKNITFVGNNFALSKFVNTSIEDVTFSSGIVMNLMNMAGVSMNRVRFLSTLSTPNLTNASLRQVDFTNLGGAKLEGASLEDVRINNSFYSSSNSTYAVALDGTAFYGDFYASSISSAAYFTLNNISFHGSVLSGTLDHMVFTGDVSFSQVTFKDIDLTGTDFPLASGTAPHAELATVRWENVTCPDGTVVSGGGSNDINGCDYGTRMTP